MGIKYGSWIVDNMPRLARKDSQICNSKGNKQRIHKEDFYWIHNESYNYNEEEFMDIKDKTIAEYVKEVEKKYCREIKELTRDKHLLRHIMKQATRETDVAMIELAAILGLSKSTVGRYLK